VIYKAKCRKKITATVDKVLKYGYTVTKDGDKYVGII
jgi:hypothetical protein